MQRAVIDTNTWISGLVWHGAPRALIQWVLQRQLQCVASPELIAEFQRVLGYPRIGKVLLARGLAASDLATQFGLTCEVISAPPLANPICRDPDDDAVLACAVAAKASLIVSGDADLLTLGQYQDISIVTAAQALVRLGVPHLR